MVFKILPTLRCTPRLRLIVGSSYIILLALQVLDETVILGVRTNPYPDEGAGFVGVFYDDGA